jgi:MGT family glycosyltransferase
MASNKILVVTFNAGGNWPPIHALIEELARRGHEVRVLSDSAHRPAIDKAGALYRPFKAALVFDSATEAGAAFLNKNDFRQISLSEEISNDVLSETASFKPDALLVDFMLKTAVGAAESAGIPTAILWHMPYRALLEQDHNAPNAIRKLNRLRRRLGVPPIKDANFLLSCGSADAGLVFTYESFDVGASELPRGFAYVGALASAQKPLPTYSGFPWSKADDRPLILVSYSTIFQEQRTILQTVADAVAGLPVKALFTLGSAVSADEINLPANVFAERFVPHTAVLPYTELVVTHGGLGTVMAAVSAGVPVVCTPMGRDQFAVSRCVERTGLGLIASKDDSAGSLRETIARALSDADLRRRARDFAAQVDAQAGLRRAAEIVEGLFAIVPARGRPRGKGLSSLVRRLFA